MVDALFGKLNYFLIINTLISLLNYRFDALNPSVTHIIRGSEPASNYAQVSSVSPK